MEKFKLSRREFVGSTGLGLFSLMLAKVHPAFAVGENKRTTYILSPEIDIKSKDPSVGVFNLNTGQYTKIKVPLLGHSIAGHPLDRNKVVMLGQRPRAHSVEIDLGAMKVSRVFEAGDGRYFYGHGSFDQKGEYLYSTESNTSGPTGTISIRDPQNFKTVSEFPSHGVGPHELEFTDNGRITVVGNGGLRSTTREEQNNEVLTMKSSLAVIETANGKLLNKFEIPHQRLSIRHLAVGPNGEVAASLKNYGDKLPVPMVALGNINTGIEIPTVPADQLPILQENAFGIEMSADGKTAAVTHPSGKVLSIWDVENRKFVNAIPLGLNPEGVTRLPGEENFLLNSYLGYLAEIDIHGKRHTRETIKKINGLNWKHASAWTV